MTNISSNLLMTFLSPVLFGSGIVILAIALVDLKLFVKPSNALRAKNKLSYIKDLVMALGFVVSGILLAAFNFRMDFLTQFVFILLAPAAIWYAFESLQLRRKNRNSSTVPPVENTEA
jgi:hypothetical protein